MKFKGGVGRKKSASPSMEVVVGSIQDAMDSGEVHGGNSDYANVNINNNPINGSEPSNSHLTETHQDQNLEEPDDDDGEGDEEDEQDGDEAAFASQRTNLDDGFYEIEAIRRKRVRKVFNFTSTLFSSFFIYSLAFFHLECENDRFMKVCTFTDFGDFLLCCFAMGMIDWENRASFST